MVDDTRTLTGSCRGQMCRRHRRGRVLIHDRHVLQREILVGVTVDCKGELLENCESKVGYSGTDEKKKEKRKKKKKRQKKSHKGRGGSL